MRLEVGTRVVLAPPFLCCGFPAHANAKTAQHSSIVLRDSILFAQIREMFANLDFDACIVTCGTCREGLAGMDAQRLFKRIVDAGAYMLERGLKIQGEGDYLYHAPCHDSLDGNGVYVLKAICGIEAQIVPHCCAEAGTLALSRPDITEAMRHRKTVATRETPAGTSGAVLLTNCPSCLQGLGRNVETAKPRHILVELAQRLSGDLWLDRLRERAAAAQAIHF